MLALPERLWSAAKHMDCALTNTHVRNEVLPHRVSGPGKSNRARGSVKCTKQCEETIDGIKRMVKRGSAVNAHGAVFADNIAITRELLTFGQTEDYAIDAGTGRRVEAERDKVFGPDNAVVCQGLRKISRAKPVLIIVARHVTLDAKPTKKNVFVLNASDADGVFRPMRCPRYEEMNVTVRCLSAGLP